MKFSYKILSILLALLIIASATVGCDQLPLFDGAFGTSETESESASKEQSVQSNLPEDIETEESTTASEGSSTETDTENESQTESDTEPERVGSVTILNGSEITVEVGESVRLTVYKSSFIKQNVGWAADSRIVYVDENGYLTALEVGDVTVTAFAGKASDSILIHVIAKTEQPTEPVETEPTTDSGELEFGDGQLETRPRDEIYEAVGSPSDHLPAGSYEEAIERTEKNQLSGYDFVPDQAPILSEYRPMQDGKYIKNNNSYYIDYNTYVVVDAYGREVFRIYRGGAYITLEEVAAYVYAFGTYPANHTSKKTTSVSGNAWGIYLRSNHSKFTGDTSKYPYEPELPRISGCGGDLIYWEMDIGTTGTDCDPAYPAKIYNNGTKIDRGAARIVYTWNDLNGNGITDPTDIVFVFYTYNHYNDFQEYLNYYGGWGEIFGNITGGGKISSKSDYNPTSYVPVIDGKIAPKTAKIGLEDNYVLFAWIDRRAFDLIYTA